jgi:DNA topoisomerase-1
MKRLTLTERVVVEPGYRGAYLPADDSATRTPRLGQYRRGQRVRPTTRVQKSPGLSEAELIRMLQQAGVGRPSTYAVTIEALRGHGYIEEREGALAVTESGQRVLAFLQAGYPFLLDLGWTARMEDTLDSLAAGKGSYQHTILLTWDKFLKDGDKETGKNGNKETGRHGT